MADALDDLEEALYTALCLEEVLGRLEEALSDATRQTKTPWRPWRPWRHWRCLMI